MTNYNETSGSPNEQAAAQTHIKTDCDLRIALSELIAEKNSEALALLHQTVWGLRSEFDPASVTMSSTNIPDAIIKLSAVLTDTDSASNKVFDLVERQGKILKQTEKEIAELERHCQGGHADPSAIAGYIGRHRALNHAMQSISNEIVTSQEFQDLCGQKIKKVMRLVCDMECYLRALFVQLKVDVPSAKTAVQAEEDKDIDQDSTDALLKELGF
jgi:chemotaxis regulatin CheY-phosphate phosphatase CheZ